MSAHPNGPAPWPKSENGDENGASTLIAQRKPEGLLLSRLSEKSEGGAQLTPLAEATPMPTLKGMAVLQKIQQQLEAEAAREDAETAISAQDLAGTIDAIRGCLEALEKIESRTLQAGEKQARWLRDELAAIENLLNSEPV